MQAQKQVYAVMCHNRDENTTDIVQVYDFEPLARLEAKKYWENRASGEVYYVVSVNFRVTSPEYQERNKQHGCL